MSNKAKVSQKASMKAALRLPFLVTFLAAAVLVAAFFLPLAVAQGEQLKQIEKYEEMGGDEIVEEYAPEWKELGAEVTGEDGKYISLYEYAPGIQGSNGQLRSFL